MNAWPVLFAALNNLQIVVFTYTIALTIGSIIYLLVQALEYDRNGIPFLLTKWKFALPVLILLIPGPDDIWKARLSLLKLELSSAENVNALTDHAKDIVKALECKHLNVNCGEKK